MGKPRTPTYVCLILLLASSGAANAAGLERLRQQVVETEKAFAQTMAKRDFDAFKSFLSDEAIFFAGESPLRGIGQVTSAWEAYFEGPQAPFSWAPKTVAVLDSGRLALSSGPVWNAAGNRIATFQSIWRLDPDGQWRIIFDKGCRYCEPPAPVSRE